MWKQFIKITYAPISYNYFYSILKNNFNLKFRKPRTDICQLCYNYGLKLKVSNNINRNEIIKKIIII